MNNNHLLRWGLFLLAILATAVSLDAQPLKIGNRDTTVAKGKIPGKLLQTLFNTTEAAFNLYAAQADMIDIATGTVSGRSTSAFRELFVPSPFVYNDIGKDTTTIPARDYATQAFSHLRSLGIKFGLENPRFESVKYDSAGYYQVNLRVVKLLYNGINDKNAPIVYPSDCPRKVSLLFRFEINRDKLLAAKIIDITGKELRRDCPSTGSAPIICLGPGIFMAGNNSRFQNRLGAGQLLNLDRKQTFYFGLHFMRPLAPKNPLLLGLALGYSNQGLSTQNDTVLRNIKVKNNTNLQIYEFKEEGKLSGIDLSLGLGYQKKLRGSLSAGIMFWAVGTLPMNNEATQSYQLSYRTGNAIKQPFKQLSDSLGVVFNQSQFRFGARLSPFMTYMFNPHMGVQLECNYHIMLNNVYPLVAEDDDFFDQYESLREQNNTLGALSTAFESVKFNSLGFRLALIYSISK